MDFELSEDQRLMKEAAREFAAKKIKPFARQWDDQERVPRETYADLAKMGYFGLLVPQQYGGLGLDPVSYAAVMEELAYGSAAVQVGLSVHNSLVCEAILRYGSKEQKERYLPKLASGELIGAYSLTEPASGTDAASLQTTAQNKDGSYMVHGNKSWVTNAGFAGLFVVFVATNRQLKSKGISCLLVEPGLPGFAIGEKEKKLGIRASDTRALHFENAAVPATCLLGMENEGFKIALSLLDNGRISIAAQAIGLAQAAFDEAFAYAKLRVQFDKPIGEFQVNQFKFADMATQIEAARLLVYRAAWLQGRGIGCTKEISMAKLCASEVANRVAYQALQIHGSVGYSRESNVERYFRDARVTEIYEGTSEAQRIVISRELSR